MNEVLQSALAGLDLARVTDCHAHLVGLGDSGAGAYVHPHMRSWRHPAQFVRFRHYLGASGVDDLSQADRLYENRLAQLAGSRPYSGRTLLLAMDEYVRPDGRPDPALTHFHTPNAMAAAAAARHPDLFSFAASVHPYREDALERLREWAGKGAKVVKWLPNAQGFHPGEERLKSFYRVLRELNLTLLCHIGHEMAVPSAKAQTLGNPLHLRLPLNEGVRVIAAHCGSLGIGEDFEQGGRKPNMELFFRLMEEKRYDGLLYGDLSAVTLLNRYDRIHQLLARQDLHHRLTQGSDYPLPAINIVIGLWPFVGLGMLTREEARGLKEVFKENPLVFDLALKRLLKRRGESQPAFPAGCFKTPEFLD